MTEAKTIGVILSGCGYLDGAEINEVVLCHLALDEVGLTPVFYAPDMEREECDPFTGEPRGQTRNVLRESARIVRGKVSSLDGVSAKAHCGWIFPGGFGCAKNLSSFATEGTAATLQSDVARIINGSLATRRPMALACIAPALAALAYSKLGADEKRERPLRLTIGNDPESTKALETLGVSHVECRVQDACFDDVYQVSTCPAYMYGDASPTQVYSGITKMIKHFKSWI